MAVGADKWVKGDRYEPYVGRWSRAVAREFVPWTGVGEGASWLDVGCGTGALTDVIVATASPLRVVGIDPSPQFVAHARATHEDVDKVEFHIGDAQTLEQPDDAYDAVVSGLVLNFVSNQQAALAEFMRVAKSGATLAAYVWDYAGRMEMLRHFWDAAVELDPAAREFDEGPRFPLCNPSGLDALFEGAGLRDVQIEAIDVPTHFVDFDDYWVPFEGGQGPAPGYLASLTTGEQAKLRDEVQARLPIKADGSLDLIARSWAAKGTVPG